MNINCSLGCKHQKNGKCALSSLEDAVMYNGNDQSIDCLYFEQKLAHTHNSQGSFAE